jgi:hypothetical protein
LTEALKNPSESAKPFLDTGNKLNEAIAALTEMSAMNLNHTRNKGSVTIISPKVSGQRTTTKEPVRKRNMTPQIAGIPRLNRHGGTRGLSSTVSLDSFNSTNNNKKGTISSKNRTNNITGSPLTNPYINDSNANIIIDTQREENSLQNASIRSPITNPSINDNSENIIDTQREENSPQTAPIWRTLRTRATQKKPAHKMNTTVYRIFCDDGGLHQGYICSFDTKEGYYKIKYQDGDIEEATEEEVDRMLRKPNTTSMARALSATRFD